MLFEVRTANQSHLFHHHFTRSHILVNTLTVNYIVNEQLKLI